MHDPISELRDRFVAQLSTPPANPSLTIDTPLANDVPWSPHLYDPSSKTAWHILAALPTSTRWHTRMREAAAKIPDLQVGICAPTHVLSDETVLDIADDLQAHIATINLDDDTSGFRLRTTVADVIYENRLALSHSRAAKILDRWLERCHSATTNHRKGITLEVLTAIMLSQVVGFEVKNRGISNRSQQMDVSVHNRRTGGILGSSELVFAEAKNWSNPVGTEEYYSVYRKIETRFGRSRLGFFITTDRFTAGVRDERLRDSRGQILVVPLDKETLPSIWRTGTSVTGNLEDAAIDAASI
jgi:hypothetical protein